MTKEKTNLNSGKGVEVEQGAASEFIDCIGLAGRLKVPVSWVRDRVRSRAEEPIPHHKFGKYVRFLWGSPELEQWLSGRIITASNRKAGRILGKGIQ
jgi:hypothetical protein